MHEGYHITVWSNYLTGITLLMDKIKIHHDKHPGQLQTQLITFCLNWVYCTVAAHTKEGFWIFFTIFYPSSAPFSFSAHIWLNPITETILIVARKTEVWRWPTSPILARVCVSTLRPSCFIPGFNLHTVLKEQVCYKWEQGLKDSLSAESLILP